MRDLTRHPSTTMPRQLSSPVATPPGGTSVQRRLVIRRTRQRIPLDLRVHRVRVKLLRLLWAATFVALVLVPLAVASGAGEQRRPWSSGGIVIELSMTTGLLGLSTLAATVVLPSRVRSLTEAFGIEQVLRSHRWLALIATSLVAVHVLLVVADRPASMALLDPLTAPPRARAGLTALVALILLCYLSLRRRQLNTRYEIWRWIHCMLAMAALVGTFLHVFWLNHLMRNAAERTVFLVILVCVGAVMINRWIRRPLASLRNAYLVKEVRTETPSVSTVVLRPAGRRRRVLSYRPGQVAWLRLDSPFGPLQANPFTIASGIDHPGELEFTIRNAGDFTASMGSVRPGRTVYVDGPYGSFNDDHIGAPCLLLIAAGVGITPMMSMLRSHAARRDPRRHCLVIGARTPSELLFRTELERLGAVLDLDVVEVVSQPPRPWTGTTGRIDEELLGEVLTEFGLADPHVFICGPGPMMGDTKEALTRLGVPVQNQHTEQFGLV
ncbi:MAG: ferredoxin reductase family protein [Kineosporiaceae bacterium]